MNINAKKRDIQKNSASADVHIFYNLQREYRCTELFKVCKKYRATLEELSSLRRNRAFDEAWRECSEIRRDYLIDGALSRRFDPSFTKFLYEKEKECEGTLADSDMIFTLEVIGDNDEA